MVIQGVTAIVTGAAGGIGKAVCIELAKRGAATVVLVARSDGVTSLAHSISEFSEGATRAIPYVGDVTDEDFRKRVFAEVHSNGEPPRICVPAAGAVYDMLAARVDKQTGQAVLYPSEQFRRLIDVDLTAPVYWALEMVAHIAEHRHARGLGRWTPAEHVQGTVIFIGSVSSQGNRGQIAYAAAKAGLAGAAATLTKEAMFHGVRCGVIHPGFTDTSMVRNLGQQYVDERILPQTQLGRLIRPEEIADAVCFMVANSAVSGQLWADAGWHPSA